MKSNYVGVVRTIHQRAAAAPPAVSCGWDKSASALDDCQSIMSRIYGEDPSRWPFGLSVSHMDPGGCYMIREASTMEPVGFVGWQERERDGRRVGYYSIGVLPGHRCRGLAKEAVRKVIAEKAGGVDEVRAMIVEGNGASEALADSLGVRVETLAKAASLRILMGR